VRKLFAGCLAVVLIGGVAFGVALFFGYRAVRPMIDDASGYLNQARQLATIGDRLENRAAYSPPATGELTEAQLRRFLAVREHVRKVLGDRWADLEARSRALEKQAADHGRELSLAEVAAMLSALGRIVVDARQTHVDALNAEGFSAREYAWVRLRVYEAAGLEIAKGIDWSQLEDLVEQTAEQAGVPVPEVTLPAIPERNRELVKPHVDTLREWLPLAFLGL
jgi:hypothetical protein